MTVIIKAAREQVEWNRRILHRLVDTTLCLAPQGLAVRSHREYAGLGAPDSNEGNFLQLLKLLAHYDSILEQHLMNPVSHQSQNELIAALASETLSTIMDEVKAAKFFSVIVDSTIDIDPFSLSLRYVTKTGNSIERFVKLKLPESFYDLLTNALTKDLGLNVNHMRGQACPQA